MRSIIRVGELGLSGFLGSQSHGQEPAVFGQGFRAWGVDQAGKALCSVHVPRPTASSSTSLRRVPCRPDLRASRWFEHLHADIDDNRGAEPRHNAMQLGRDPAVSGQA